MIVFFSEKKQIAPMTWEICLKSDKKINFSAGYSFRVNLPGEQSRFFSFINPPRENVNVKFVFRDSRSTFKQKLLALKTGQPVEIDSINGVFTLPKLKPPAEQEFIFIAGGVGIAPFLSIIADERTKRLRPGIKLFTVDKSPETQAYSDELTSYEKNYSKFDMENMYHVSTSKTAIQQRIRRYINEKFNTIQTKNGGIYIAGSPSFVESMRNLCMEQGVISGKIHTESFTGYEIGNYNKNSLA